MSRDATGTRIDTDRPLAERAVDLLGDGSTPAAKPESPAKPCAACGEPHAERRLLMTIDWEEYLSDHHGVPYPEDECHVPLCARCASHAELIEIAEMNLHRYGRTQRLKILEERNRFLESLRPDLIANLSVSTAMNTVE